MVFNSTFDNISVVSWGSVLLVEEPGVPGEDHRPDECHWQPLSHNAALVVIDTDCIDICKFNHHTITTTTAPSYNKCWWKFYKFDWKFHEKKLASAIRSSCSCILRGESSIRHQLKSDRWEYCFMWGNTQELKKNHTVFGQHK